MSSVAAIGGGHGLSRALGALRALDVEPTAVVTVADDGGSSGRLRDELGIIPPGDLRMALLALARNRPLADVLAHRFRGGALDRHALGNLLLVALAQRHGDDFLAALAEAGRLLDCAGRVLPATTEAVRLHARVSGGELQGQARIASASGRVERVWLDPSAPVACAQAVDAIAAADVVLLGPGSLFTSVIATLLVPGLADAVVRSSAAVVYIANIRTQVGETSGLDLDAHVGALLDHVPGLRLDAVVAHDGPSLEAAGEPLIPELTASRAARLVTADLVARAADGVPGWGHDPQRLALALRPLLATAPGEAGRVSGPRPGQG